MKLSIYILFVIATVTIPSPVYCSYLKDCISGPAHISESVSPHLCAVNGPLYSRCLLEIDLIKETVNKEKKAQLRTILEVDLLCLMDRVLFEIEQLEPRLIYQTRMRDENLHPSLCWDVEILKTLDLLNSTKEGYAEVEELIELYTR